MVDSEKPTLKASKKASKYNAETRKQLGERIRAVWAESRLTQPDFSNTLEITSVTLSNYMRGDRVPDAVFIQMLCEKHNICFEWILTGRGAMRPEDAVNETLSPTSRIMLEEERRELSAENRQLHRDKAALLQEIADMRERIARLEEQAIALKTQCKGGVMDTAVPASAPSAPSTNPNNDRA